MQSIKRLVYAKNNRVWLVKQTTSGSLKRILESSVLPINAIIFRIHKIFLLIAKNYKSFSTIKV